MPAETPAHAHLDQMLVFGTDAARARETARGPLRFLSGVSGYRANFARMGFTDTDTANLGDRLVDELVAWGDADTIPRGSTSTWKLARTRSCSPSWRTAISVARSRPGSSPAGCSAYSPGR